MQMENRIVSVHRCDRVGIVLGPSAAVFLCDINQALAHASLLRVLKEMNSLCGRHRGGSLEGGTHPLAQLRQPLHRLTAEDESDVAIDDLAAPAAHHSPAS